MPVLGLGYNKGGQWCGWQPPQTIASKVDEKKKKKKPHITPAELVKRRDETNQLVLGRVRESEWDHEIMQKTIEEAEKSMMSRPQRLREVDARGKTFSRRTALMSSESTAVAGDEEW